MNLPVSQQLFVQATITRLHENSDRFFDFVHAGQRHHCYYTGSEPGGLRALALQGLAPLGLAPGQRVVMRGRWSPAVLQVFEADAVRVLRDDYVPAVRVAAAPAAAWQPAQKAL